MFTNAQGPAVSACWLLCLWIAGPPAGALLASDNFPVGDALVVISVEEGEPRELVSLPGLHCEHPRWSPDGNWIAFSTTRIPDEAKGARESGKVLVIPAAGDKATVLALGSHPTWSPDGSRLAWDLPDSQLAQGARIMVADFDGTTVSVKGAKSVSPGHSPAWKSHNELHFVNFLFVSFAIDSGKQSRALFPIVLRRTHYGTSPDGKYVVHSNLNSDYLLCVTECKPFREPPNTPYTKARPATGESHGADWSSDGSLLAAGWRENSKAPYQIVTLTPFGVDGPKTVRSQDSSRWNIEPSWSPDGKSIVCRQVEMKLGPYILGDKELGIER